MFTKIICPILKWARGKGIRISAYLDNILIAAASRKEVQQHTQLVHDQLACLGFLIKESKLTLDPTQDINHLGFRINTTDMSLSVPRSKVHNLCREAVKIMQAGTIQL